MAFSIIFSTAEARDYLHLNGTYVQESVIFHKGDSPLFLSYPILLDSDYFLKKAVEAHSQKTEFFIEEKFYENMLKRAKAEQNKPIEERRTFIFKDKIEYEKKDEDYFISTDKLEEREITRWFFKDVSKKYGELLQESGVKKMPVWFPKREYLLEIEQPFLRQIWVCFLKEHKKGDLVVRGNSGVSANNAGLHEASRLVGILKNE